MSLIEKIIDHSINYPNKTAFIFNNESISYKDFLGDIKKVAENLKKDGAKEKDLILIRSENRYEFICCYFAIQIINCVVANIPNDASKDYEDFIFSEVKPKIFIKECKDFFDNCKNISFSQRVKINTFDSSDILFTSGTTDRPKGVTFSHDQIYKATAHIVKNVGNKFDDIEIILMPLSHSFGLARLRSVLFQGGTSIIGIPLNRLKKVFKAIEDYNVSGFGLVPAAWKFITTLSGDKVKKFSKQLNYIEFGSAYMSPEDKKHIKNLFPSTNLMMHYGLTEVSRAVFLDFHKGDLNSVGSTKNGTKVLIMDQDENILGDDQEGEILFNSPWMSKEYFNDKPLTKASFIDGFIKTGDVGKIKENQLYFLGRLKEIINVGGKKVSPIAVEKIFNSFPFIEESACTSLIDEKMGEVVQIYLVVDKNSKKEINELRSEIDKLISNKLPVYMRPMKYTFLKSFPKTTTGKIKKKSLGKIESEVLC